MLPSPLMLKNAQFVVEVVGEADVGEVATAEVRPELERAAGAVSGGGIGEGAIDVERAAGDRRAAAGAAALRFPGAARPAGRQAGPPENSSPTVGPGHLAVPVSET